MGFAAKTEPAELIDFSEEQFWNGDVHLARVIGTMALQHRDHGVVYPSNLEVDEWHRILTRIGEPLLAYANAAYDHDEGDAARRAAAKQSLELFANWFDHFTD